MLKVYSTPAEIPVPEFDWTDLKAYQEKENKFIEDLRKFCINRNNAEYVGEVIQFPVADGYAQYMVASLKPVELIHLPIVDAWQYPYIERLTKNDIVDKINQKRAMDKLFSRSK
jgi:hypothetical protein